MLPDRPGWKSIWLGLAGTPTEQGYLYVINEVRTSQTAVFDRRLTIGPADQDSDDFISTLSMGDWSGGGQIDELSGADQSRYWWGIFDNRSPHQAALPPRVYNPDSGKPSGATGTSYPLGVVNNTAYFAFGTDICGFNESGQVWYTKESMGHAPVGKPISFNGKLFVPCGVNGYKIVTESGTGNPTVTAVTGAADPTTHDEDTPIQTSPRPVAFAIFESDKIFALTTTGGIAWSQTGDNNDWTWDWRNDTASYPKINSSFTPYGLKPYFNRNGISTLFINHSGGVYIYDRAVRMLNDTSILAPSFPNMAKAMEIWRPGEDLWVSMGLDIIHYTAANTTVPLSGVNRDAGLPAEYRGAIVDLQAEMSALYALVGGDSETYRSFEYAAKTGSAGTGNGQFSNIQAAATDSLANIFIADTNNERIQKFNTSLTYQTKVGASGSSTGQFAADDGVYDIDVDASDNVWAVDAANHRIQKFNNSLTYQSMIDGRVTIVTLNSQVSTIGTNGIGNDNFDGPTSLAIDPSTGKIAIADYINNRIVVKTSGEVFSTSYTGLTEATSLSYDASGNMYYAYWSGGSRYHTKRNAAGTVQWTTLFNSTFTCKAGTTDGTYVYYVGNLGTLPYIGKYRVSDGVQVSSVALPNGASGNYNGITTAGGYLYLTCYTASTAFLYRISPSNLSVVTTLFSCPQSLLSGSLYAPWGIEVSPTSGNLFMVDPGSKYVNEFTALGVFVQRFTYGSFSSSLPDIAITTAGDYAYVSDYTNDRLVKFGNSSTVTYGTADDKFNRPKYVGINRTNNALWTFDSGNTAFKQWDITSTPAYTTKLTYTTGASDGAFHSSGPGRFAVEQSGGSNYRIYILDPGNARVNVYQVGVGWQTAFGGSGTGNGQFQTPVGITVNEGTGHVFVTDSGRDDVQEFTATGAFVRKFGGTGTGDGQMTGPAGIGASRDGTYIYVTDATQSRFTQFSDAEITDSLSSIPHLQSWTGIGWGGVWEGTQGVVPTWMQVVNVVGAYYLTWGASDGLIYRMKLQRNNIHNPRQLLQPFGLGDYAATGYIETATTDMNMLGFKKIASHVKVFMRNANSTERVKVSIDVDDTGWQELGWVSQTGQTTFPLNVQTVSETGETASLGIPFNWVRMKFDMERGNDTVRTPIIRSVNLHFLKIPQNTTTYAFDVVLPKVVYLGRDGRDISDYINSLLTANEMVLMKHQGKLFRGRLSNVTGVDVTGEDMSGIRSINFLEISDEGGS